MADLFHLHVSSPHGSVYDGEVLELQLETPDGPLTVMADHMPLVVPVAIGVLSFRKDIDAVRDTWDHYAVSDGLLAVDQGGVNVAVGSAEHGGSVDVLNAQRELEEAKAKLSTQRLDEELAATSGNVERHLARLTAAGHYGGKVRPSSRSAGRVERKISGR